MKARLANGYSQHDTILAFLFACLHRSIVALLKSYFYLELVAVAETAESAAMVFATVSSRIGWSEVSTMVCSKGASQVLGKLDWLKLFATEVVPHQHLTSKPWAKLA